jgi:hypothetical protein
MDDATEPSSSSPISWKASELLEISFEASTLLNKAHTYYRANLEYFSWLYQAPDNHWMAAINPIGFSGRGTRNPRVRRIVIDEESGTFRLKDEDYAKIVDYLEVPENFQAVTGGGRKTSVGKKYGTKAVVFKKMVAAMQHHGFPTNMDGANLQKRFQRYVKRYKDALEVKLDTGGGLLQEEIDAGVLLHEKLNKLCPHFERMHALYGERPNVAPPVLGDVGVEEEELIHHVEQVEENNAIDLEPEPEPEREPELEIELEPEAEHGDVERADTATELLPEEPPATPSTLARGITMAEAKFWDEMENVPGSHGYTCTCPECRIVVNLSNHDMESSQPYTQQTSPRALRTISHNVQNPVQKSKQKNLAKDVPVKTPQQVAKDMAVSTKPSFTSIYAEKLSLKADYRTSLIVTRDKWKAQELEERRLARVEALMETKRQNRLARKHLLTMETLAAEAAMKKARVEFENSLNLTIEKSRANFAHEKQMAEQNRRTALLTTLLASNKTPDEIKSLLPIIDQ